MKLQADVAILGSGFGGSLAALLIQRIGLRAVLVDRGSHPRFAIGESTTPTANLVLRDLCAAYDLPRLAPLTKYGTWKESYPRLTCGPKRGFSYFQQRPGETFDPGRNHDRELLVAASSTLPTADTHWLRSEVDAFLAHEAQESGVPYFDRLAVRISREGSGFRLTGERDGASVTIDANFLIDATGEAGVVLRTLGIPQVSRNMATHSRAIFGHFTGLTRWRDQLVADGINVTDHPYDCDQSALHHVFEEGWMWQLRFDNGVTSAGFSLDGNRAPLDLAVSAADEWSRWMDRYPAIADQFSSAQLIAPAGGLFRSGRMQRRALRAAGENWAALPHTAGFVDPLHSTGIAHSLCGVERLVGVLAAHWGRPSLPAALAGYGETVLGEIDCIDEIVGSCFASLGCFDAFAACCMVYFAAATTYEHRRLQGEMMPGAACLCADDLQLRSLVSRVRARLTELMTDPQPSRVSEFCDWIKDKLAPFNRVGLFASEIRNMYRQTAVPGA